MKFFAEMTQRILGVESTREVLIGGKRRSHFNRRLRRFKAGITAIAKTRMARDSAHLYISSAIFAIGFVDYLTSARR